jgi:hypothetical protein
VHRCCGVNIHNIWWEMLCSKWLELDEGTGHIEVTVAIYCYKGRGGEEEFLTTVSVLLFVYHTADAWMLSLDMTNTRGQKKLLKHSNNALSEVDAGMFST